MYFIINCKLHFRHMFITIHR